MKFKPQVKLQPKQVRDVRKTTQTASINMDFPKPATPRPRRKTSTTWGKPGKPQMTTLELVSNPLAGGPKTRAQVRANSPAQKAAAAQRPQKLKRASAASKKLKGKK